MPVVTLMRHGKTSYNLSKTFSGLIDCPLTEKGIEDASKVPFTIDDFDVYICSELSRTKQTLNAFIPGVIPIIDGRINELDLGDFTDTPITEESMSLVLELRERDTRFMNVETKKETRDRVVSFFHHLFNDYDDETRILVVCHNGILMEAKNLFFENYNNAGSKNLETVTITRENYNYYNGTKIKKLKGNISEF